MNTFSTTSLSIQTSLTTAHRYALQKDWVPLPKSDDPTRIHENADIYDFEISQEDMEALNGLDQGPAGAMDEDAWAVADMKKPA